MRKKVAVYTIAKNEANFIERWIQSAQEADLILVADTGSTDDTANLAMNMNANVVKLSVSPWRFDDARNAALANIPADFDLCISLDADEVLVQGWRQIIDDLDPSVTRPRYKYVWSWNPDGSEGLTYSGDKIHARTGYRWKHPVHEILTPSLGFREVQGWCELEIHHYPDHTKSRGQYISLLEWAVQEDPADDRNAFYLGREYSYRREWNKAKSELLRYLELPRSVWPPERAAAKRLLAQCEPHRAEYWLVSATEESPHRREPWVELAQYYHDQNRWAECYSAVTRALSIVEKPLEYICEASAWNEVPYDLAAISAYHLGLSTCLRYGAQAVVLNRSDERLATNYAFYVLRFGLHESTGEQGWLVD